MVNQGHCFTGSDAAFPTDDRQLRGLRWSDVNRVEVRFRGDKRDQVQVGSVIVRTRSEVRGPCSDLGERGGTVALMVSLLRLFCGST